MAIKETKLNLKAFIDEIEALDEFTEYTRMRALWRAIVYQALLDLNSNSTSKRSISHKIKARAFFFRYSSELDIICQFAGLDKRAIILKAREVANKK